MAYRGYRRTNYRPRTTGWRGPAPLEVLNESVTMSAAGTATELEIILLEEVAKMNRGRIKAMMIKEIHVEVMNATAGVGVDVASPTTEFFMFQVTSSSQGTSEIAFSDKDCVFKYLWYPLDHGTAGNHVTYEMPKIFKFPGAGIPYIKKRIWVQCDDAGQAGANTYHFKIYYYFKYLNKKTQTRIISQLQ